jgi:predicted MFS family arabinose efflux permease
MPRPKRRFEQTQSRGWHEVLAPLRDASFRRLLAYGCWFSIFNGLTAAPQTSYPRQTLGLGVGDVNAMRTGMRLGQFALSRPLGFLCDRFDNRRVMLVSQLCVAAAPLCFLIATPSRTYWIFVAYLLWSWYVGLNIGLPNWILRHAPRGESSPYLSAYFGVTGVCYAVAAIVGGYLLDQLTAHWGAGPLVGDWTLIHLTFLFAWVTRTFGAALLARVPEASSARHEMR